MGLLHIATHEVQFARDSVAVDGALIVDASTLLQCSFNGMCSPVHRGALALSRSSQERESDVGIFHERHRGKDAGEAMRLQQLQGFGPGTLRFVETLLPSQVGAAQPERMGERAMLGDLATHRYRAIQHFQRFCIAGTLCFDHCAHRRRPRLRVAVRSFVHDLLEAFGHHEHARLTHLWSDRNRLVMADDQTRTSPAAHDSSAARSPRSAARWKCPAAMQCMASVPAAPRVRHRLSAWSNR